MDIPAPTKIPVNIDEPGPKPEAEAVSTSIDKTEPTTATSVTEKQKPSTEANAEETTTSLAELVSSKKYALNIKERRTKPLLVLSLGTKKRKQTQKKKPKKEKVPQTKRKKTIEIVAFVAIWIGLYVAIDMGVLDIGWKPPFSLFGGAESGEVTGTVQVEGNTATAP